MEDLNLIKSLGRSPLPGHPIQYGTTVDFLRYFGLNSLNELPEISLEAELFRRIYEPTEAKGKTRRAGSVSADAADSAASAPNGDGEEPGAEIAAEAEGGEELDLDAPSAGLKKLLNKIKKRRLAEEREAAEKSEPERRG
ncbi:SMC-Scp complex subunit ScpB [bacterium]|nr:SMC-Scp complex subunit ScpB [bacterium]